MLVTVSIIWQIDTQKFIFLTSGVKLVTVTFRLNIKLAGFYQANIGRHGDVISPTMSLVNHTRSRPAIVKDEQTHKKKSHQYHHHYSATIMMILNIIIVVITIAMIINDAIPIIIENTTERLE